MFRHKESHKPFPFRQVIKEVANTRRLAAKEQYSPWGVDGAYWGVTSSLAIGKEIGTGKGAAESYEVTFAPLGRMFHRKVIRDFLVERQQTGKSTIMLDLLGGEGEAARQLTKLGYISGAITENLTDFRNDEQKVFDAENGLVFTTGNLVQRKTWRNIDEALKVHGGKADLITIRGRMAYFNSNPREVYGVLLKRALDRLNPGGSLFTDVPTRVMSEWLGRNRKREREFKKFLESLKTEYPGLEYKFVPDYHDFKNFDPFDGIPYKRYAGVLRIDLKPAQA